ncbi:MAG TPA: multidrug transporter subunit MdtD [Casimicrobiaceae bacterium]|jgi:EmrB/QacA subfamily drug resistance transporter
MPNDVALSRQLWLVAVGFFMQTLDSTIVNTALPSMARSLGESPLRMQSVVVAYTLTMAALIPASGWIADRFGLRNTFLAAIALFTLGSIACAASPTLKALVASRVLQGLGGAMLLPVGRLSLLRTFPRHRLLEAMSFVAIPGLIGPLIGPTLGGWLTEVASWHWIFLINVPVGVAGAVATRLYMAQVRVENIARFDWSGYTMLTVGMIAVSLALDGLGELGLRQATVLVLLIGGFAGIVAYWLHASRHRNPLFAPSLFGVPSFRVGLLGNLFARIGISAMPFLLPLMLQVSLGYSPLEAGMMMLPVSAASMLMKRYVMALVATHGYRRVLIVNTLALGVTIACFAGVFAPMPLALKCVMLAALGAQNSLQFSAMNTIVLKDLGPREASGGNSLLSMSQMLAMSLGVTTAGTLLAMFGELFGATDAGATLLAFRATLASIGILTAASAWIFWQLEPETERGT